MLWVKDIRTFIHEEEDLVGNEGHGREHVKVDEDGVTCCLCSDLMGRWADLHCNCPDGGTDENLSQRGQ